MTMFFRITYGQGGECHVHETGGYNYDFSPLMKNEGEDDYEIPKSDSSGTFYYNICGPIHQKHGMCQGQFAMTMLDLGLYCASTADETNKPKWELLDPTDPGGGLKGTWMGTQCATGIYSTTIEFPCDPNKADGIATKAVSGGTGISDCSYLITIPSKWGCPTGGGGGVTWGSEAILVVFVLFACYCIGGIVYNKKVKGASGKEMIPNVDRWLLLPGLVRDGCTYTAGKLKGVGKKGESDSLL